MKPISQLRFESLAGYSRSPTMTLVARDLECYEEADEKILGLVALDLPDQDYVCHVLGRDAKGRFRAVWLKMQPRQSGAGDGPLGAKAGGIRKRAA